MRRNRRWALSLATGTVVACAENLTAPAVCPPFCPPTQVTVLDTIVRDAIRADSSFRGYLSPHLAAGMQLVATGGPVVSYGLLRFFPFADSVFVTGIPGRRPIVAQDSFHLRLTVARRPAADSGLEIVVHRLPVTVDSLSTFEDLVPYFADSTVVGEIALPDTVPGDTLLVRLPGNAFPTLVADSFRAAVGLALRAPTSTYLDLGTSTSGQVALLTMFAQADSAEGKTAAFDDARQATFDSYVFTGIPSAPDAALAVGGAPSARALLRVALPARILDSAEVVRATLILVPAEPAVGATGDTLRVRADGVAADFGPKSPVIPSGGDVPELEQAAIPVGSADTIRLDVTHIVRPWGADSLRPRMLVVRPLREAASPAEVRFLSSAAPQGAPALHVTYVPLVAVGRR